MNLKLKEYLKENYLSIEFKNASIKDLNIMDKDIRDHKVFLMGENHGVRSNAKLKMGFLKYFKEKIGFKYYISELPASMIYFINIYLETGDEEVLKGVYEALKGTDAWNLDEYNHWIELYNYNKKFSKSKRIVPIGIDIEHQEKNAFKFMRHSLNKEGAPRAIVELLNEIENKDRLIKNEDLKDFSRKVKVELEKKEARYKEILAEDYFLFHHINDNILNKANIYSSNNFDGFRDEKIYVNFLNLTKDLKKEKYFGQIGLSHIFQRSFPHIDWFGKSLNEGDSKFKGRVLSIAYAYKDCKYLYPTPRRDYIAKIDTMDLSIEEFKTFIQGKHNLFKLNQRNSPFTSQLIWPLEHKIPNGGVTTDYFQYLIVIRASKEMESLRGFFK